MENTDRIEQILIILRTGDIQKRHAALLEAQMLQKKLFNPSMTAEEFAHSSLIVEQLFSLVCQELHKPVVVIEKLPKDGRTLKEPKVKAAKAEKTNGVKPTPKPKETKSQITGLANELKSLLGR